jgi:hypothetical protein
VPNQSTCEIASPPFEVIREAQERPKSPYTQHLEDALEIAGAFNEELVYDSRRSHRKELKNLLGLQRRPF